MEIIPQIPVDKGAETDVYNTPASLQPVGKAPGFPFLLLLQVSYLLMQELPIRDKQTHHEAGVI